jgi:hypothetical protein
MALTIYQLLVVTTLMDTTELMSLQSGCYNRNSVSGTDIANWIRIGDVVHVTGHKDLITDNGNIWFPIIVGNGASMKFISGHGVYNDPNSEGIESCEMKPNGYEKVKCFSIKRPGGGLPAWLQPYELNYSAGGTVRYSYTYLLKPLIFYDGML